MLESVVKKLQTIARPGSFCTSLTAPAEILELNIKGIGDVEFPISPAVAKSLVKHAKPAKFGRKDKTIYDPTVRNVWEIPRSSLKISGARWKNGIASVLAKVGKDLAMPDDTNLNAQLHNLLIYEPGQFFAPHQDSEKLDDMVATLVVLLPSKFNGGSLVVDQHGDKKKFPVPRNVSDKLTFIAFYPDCHHEVKKVTAGYRIAITYNLVVKNGRGKLSPIVNQGLTKSLSSYFQSGESRGDQGYRQNDPRWMVYLLDHQYTQKSLNWQLLKGADRAVASQMLFAAGDLELQPYLALADIHQVWDAESDDWDHSHRRRYWRNDDEDHQSEHKGDVNADDIDLNEIVVNDCTLNHWVDADGMIQLWPENWSKISTLWR
jgi:predicted 2-oxoglutarate/Fe(II)-dependent dioxygenase YbiX